MDGNFLLIDMFDVTILTEFAFPAICIAFIFVILYLIVKFF